MSLSSGPTIQEIEVVGLVLPVLAAIITSFRLVERIRQRRLWLDDAWAALALMFNIIECVTSYLYLHNFEQYSRTENIALYYVIVQFFCATVWASRISILFTVVRLTSPFSALRKVLILVFAAFLMTWGILFGQSIWICQKVAIAQVITDVVGDTLLITIPCQMVYKIKLSWSQKVRVITIFSASAITTAVCLTHGYFVFTIGGLQEGIAAIIETSVSLIVANLSVVVAFFFRIGTEETTAFSPNELKSIITFGSQPIRQRVPRNPFI